MSVAKDKKSKAMQADPRSLRERIWRVIFLSDSGLAKAFDVLLLIMIIGSVSVVMLDSVERFNTEHARSLKIAEWVFTVLFTIEFAARMVVVRNRRRYLFSFFGMVDLLSILPTYLELFVVGSGHLIIIRVLRLLRMFRILKMVNHMNQTGYLVNALRASRPKIAVFLFGVMTVVCVLSTIMYIIEGGSENSQFTSIPQSIYWGIVTITTVGYGDIAPVTVVGKMLASVMMLTGFAILAVPTGIVTAELHRELNEVKMDTRRCPGCGYQGHDPAALHCKMCGEHL